MEHTASLAVVGAAGGVGTTRLTLGMGVALAEAGRDVAVLDAAYETQGLSDRIEGTIDPDMTALCLEETPLAAGLCEIEPPSEEPSRLAVCPAHAPFERICRAKAPEAATAFEERIAEATRAFDHVLIDTPPVAANQAVAAVNGAESVAVVCDAARIRSGVPRTRDRLGDVGVSDPAVVVTGVAEHDDATVAVSTLPERPLARGSADGVRSAAEALVGVSIDDESGLLGRFA
ncbi:MAG: AAA family ATPase [Natronomonas sp.]